MSDPWTPPPPVGGAGNMNYATWADRVLAAIIDGLLVMAALIVLYVVITIISLLIGGIGMGLGGAAGGDSGGAIAGVAMLGVWGICCIAFVVLPIVSLGVGLYNKVYLVGKRGCSIGQGIMKLNVVTASGGRVPTGTLVLRLLVQMAFGFVPLLPLLSILWPLWDPQRQALHDKAVGTFVIKVG